MNRPVRLLSPGGIVRTQECGDTLRLGKAVVWIDWVEPSDDDLAQLLLALVGETTLAEVLGPETKREDT